MVRTIVGYSGTKKVIGTVCKKLGIMDQETVDRVYEKIKDRISAGEYNDLTPDEVLIINRAIEENRSGAY
jgi:hypothetical protein